MAAKAGLASAIASEGTCNTDSSGPVDWERSPQHGVTHKAMGVTVSTGS